MPAELCARTYLEEVQVVPIQREAERVQRHVCVHLHLGHQVHVLLVVVRRKVGVEARALRGSGCVFGARRAAPAAACWACTPRLQAACRAAGPTLVGLCRMVSVPVSLFHTVGTRNQYLRS